MASHLPKRSLASQASHEEPQQGKEGVQRFNPRAPQHHK